MTDEAYYYAPGVTRFQVLLEEVTRARPGAADSRFIAPDEESLARLEARFHHVLYGRRGTGKSSLLRKIEKDRIAAGTLVAWADQETFMGLSYPDVLVGTLAEVFGQFAVQVRNSDVPRKASRWRKRESTENELLANELEDAVAQLNSLKNSPSESEIDWTAAFSISDQASRSSTAGGSASHRGFGALFSRTKTRQQAKTQSDEFVHHYTATKREHLERAVTLYRRLATDVSKRFPDSFIILDDFYRLSESDQPNIAGYFHRVVKDTSVWLKFGSIPFWTRLYAGGSPAIGIQVPHDLREVSLDRGLLEFKTSKRFLEAILNTLATEVGVEINRLFSSGSLDRLVLAAGGVPRDYIGLVSDAIGVAKNRGPSAKVGTERVIVEDVNEAAGRTVAQKFADLDEDAAGEAGGLRQLIIKLTNHCRTTKSACFLIDVQNAELVEKLGRLQNMRFAHLIDPNESLPNLQSSRYRVYLLDVSQLAAQRAWKVDFMGWTKREKRRARKLVFTESANDESPLTDSAEEQGTQTALFDDDVNDEAAVVKDIEKGPAQN